MCPLFHFIPYGRCADRLTWHVCSYSQWRLSPCQTCQRKTATCLSVCACVGWGILCLACHQLLVSFHNVLSSVTDRHDGSTTTVDGGQVHVRFVKERLHHHCTRSCKEPCHVVFCVLLPDVADRLTDSQCLRHVYQFVSHHKFTHCGFLCKSGWSRA